MSRYVMKGGTLLSGEVCISGAKNAALGILAGALLTDETVIIDNIPDVDDIDYLLNAFKEIGVVVDRDEKTRNRVIINASMINTLVVDLPFLQKLRGSYYIVGALLGKYRHAEVVMPGGCNIGERPIEQHIKGFTALGADVEVKNGKIVAIAKELKGADIFLDLPTVGGTINIMLAAVLAEGKTTIENAAKEPHVVDVANLLNSMGANIKGAGTDVIRINGVKKLHKTEYSIIPDQIEAGTFMLAAVATKGDIVVKNVIPKHLESISSKLREMGCDITEGDDAVRVNANNPLKSIDVRTAPYPGFPTDMHPQMSVAMCLAHGTSTVTEKIFEKRFKYVDELTKMSANVMVKGNNAIISGVDHLTGATIQALDLRAGAALVIAGLAAEGFTIIEDVEYIERGYERFVEKMKGLGALIDNAPEDSDIIKFKMQNVAV